ncbi:cyclin-dependent kinase-like Serine/Threonine kinase family protein (macronuclear) [Tetrahymena thermophila SB210]|uniref:Cyclin-dependent kinase 2 homolog n=1 Tax=Tetrahymena thermophila (strain SB210) TaxID=312017 RepID=Q232Z4_TETTS|nr:cyclin-dependent kinase-like Serine/Threonine kinase family protein [Tetrahymena thermophila SB210]EAR91686.1 cyclin-dependent kinase-like Serine/Threonine kinase family protein [Tetrahymena thermophila SB210]|eukprot:XP_001011931.1 cyclin-dependent kinase-like Serine/Threonine kinase family protein [Tetrahymena thermophila SB210]
MDVQQKRKVYNQKYLRIKKINEGSFGKIILCELVDQKGQYCVLKKFKVTQQSAIDELSIKEIYYMKKLDHPNLVKSDDIFKIKKSYNGQDFFEQLYMHLPYYLEMSEVPRENLSVEAIKILIKQLIEAVHFLHQKKIIHRDIKPSNIFLDKTGKLLLGDMGISRDFPENKDQELTGNTITRLYRPPEILFGCKKYNETVDLWSLGCTIAEFFMDHKKYFFQGKSEIDQLCKVFEIRGSANEQNWPGCTELPYYMDFGELNQKDLSSLLPKAPKECIEIIDSLLQLCPQKRAKIEDIIQNKWLQSTTEQGFQELKQFAENNIQSNIHKILHPPERF